MPPVPGVPARRRASRSLVPALLVVALLAACSGSDEQPRAAQPPTAAPTTTAPAATTTTPAPSSPPAAPATPPASPVASSGAPGGSAGPGGPDDGTQPGDESNGDFGPGDDGTGSFGDGGAGDLTTGDFCDAVAARAGSLDGTRFEQLLADGGDIVSWQQYANLAVEATGDLQAIAPSAVRADATRLADLAVSVRNALADADWVPTAAQRSRLRATVAAAPEAAARERFTAYVADECDVSIR